jgi:hypothetical protein
MRVMRSARLTRERPLYKVGQSMRSLSTHASTTARRSAERALASRSLLFASLSLVACAGAAPHAPSPVPSAANVPVGTLEPPRERRATPGPAPSTAVVDASAEPAPATPLIEAPDAAPATTEAAPLARESACNEQPPQDFLVRGNFLRDGAAAVQRAIQYRTDTYGYFPGFGHAGAGAQPPKAFVVDTTFMNLPIRMHRRPNS